MTEAAPKKAKFCNFCMKQEHEVRRLVEGPGVAICDACAVLVWGILASPKSPSTLTKEQENGHG